MIKEKIVIKEKLSGKRIDKVCAERFPEFSRTEWQKRGSFMRNGTVTTGKTKVQVGEEWEVCCEDAPLVSDEILPWKFDLKVLKDSKSWLVIEKPEGVSVHPSLSEGSQETIVNALVNLFGKNLSENYDEIDGRKVARPGLVHRLDKITSGVLLVAKTNTTHRILQENWKDVEKIYVAVVHGCPPKKGKIEAGLARDFRDRKKMAVSSDERARQATTEFERIEFNKQKNLSLLKVKILTGRTHQIRV
ncbi:MAG: pseudouridine synthase, partial [Candidatus Peregrinibacteria bacterium]|nr:pseudouridine synthase [Candidatus Peregrinibacteria bacterium]